MAFTCVFGIARPGAVWCPINPRNEAAENRELLDLFDCTAPDLPGGVRAAGRARSAATCPKLTTLVCLDGRRSTAPCRWEEFLGRRHAEYRRSTRAGRRPGDDRRHRRHHRPTQGRDADRHQPGDDDGDDADGLPVRRAGRSTSRWRRSPTPPGVLCFPVLALGGEIVVMPQPDVGGFLELVETPPGHAHVPAADADLHAARARPASTATDLSSLQCFWYGAAPMSAARLEEALTRIGPVMAQLFGQTEAPMMISMMPPARPLPRRRDASPRERLASAGRPAPLVTVAIMDERRRAAAAAASAARSSSAARW